MILKIGEVSSFHALEPLLAHKYKMWFNGIRLLSVERIDLTQKLASEIVE
jgi:hypothetical protein